MAKYIREGDRAEISFRDREGDGHRKLTTMVEAFMADKGEVLVLMPMFAGTMIKLPLSRDYSVRFYSQSSIMVYDAKIVEHPIIDGIHLTKLRLESEGEKIQLRDYYRISTVINFNFTIAGAEVDPIKGPKFYRGVTKDISGGGMSFISDKDIKDGTEVYANLMLEDEYMVILVSVMGKQVMHNAAFKYLYRCKFLAMPDMEQEKILQYINKEQLKTISRTKG